MSRSSLVVSLLLVALAGCSTYSSTSASYWTDSEGKFVRDSSGRCVRTGTWTAAGVNPTCDPDLFKVAPVVVAPKPTPAPVVEVVKVAPPAPVQVEVIVKHGRE
jgi:OOP family OmpA-OmpF porin